MDSRNNYNKQAVFTVYRHVRQTGRKLGCIFKKKSINKKRLPQQSEIKGIKSPTLRQH